MERPVHIFTFGYYTIMVIKYLLNISTFNGIFDIFLRSNAKKNIEAFHFNLVSGMRSLGWDISGTERVIFE